MDTTLAFIYALNLCPIIWTRTAEFYDHRTQSWYIHPGYEAVSIYGEIRSFTTWENANAWRIAEIREYLASSYRYDSAVQFTSIWGN